MRDYLIMTDSCASLNEKEAAELGVVVLPLSFRMEGKDYRDLPSHADMNPKEFFQKIGEGVECTTSAVNVGQYTAAMEAALAEGKDILCICFSSALSTTYQSACIAANDLLDKNPDAKIIVVDSLCACRGMGMLVYRTARECKEKGLDIEAAVEFVRTQRDHQDHWFFVDDLNHLKRGGRVSAMTAVAGNLLGIKPVMHCDAEGKLTPVSKARGYKGALKALVDKMAELGIEPEKNQPIFICHADCPDYVAYISGLLRERFGVTDIRPDYICPVIGAHTGCGTLGLFFVGKER